MKDEPDRGEIYLNQLNGTNNWFEICMHYDLSEEFMEEFENCLDWTTVSMRQTMSEIFIRKYLHKLNLNYILCYNRGMPWDLKHEIEGILSQRRYEGYRNKNL